MSTIYFIFIFIVCFIVIKINKSIRKENETPTPFNKPEISTQNKWLNPSDDFGKMEKGRTFNSEFKKYLSDKNVNED